MNSGVVRSIKGNPWQNKTLWSFQLDSDRTFYNLGEVKPNFSEGQTVSFDGEAGKRQGTFNVKAGSVQVLDAAVVKPTEYSMAAATGGAKRTESFIGKDAYWSNREAKDEVTQKRIEIQAARNAAIALLAALNGDDPADVDSFLKEWTDKFLADNEERLSA